MCVSGYLSQILSAAAAQSGSSGGAEAGGLDGLDECVVVVPAAGVVQFLSFSRSQFLVQNGRTLDELLSPPVIGSRRTKENGPRERGDD